MKLIIGLGNPGEAYANTRHNAGRRLMEFVASYYGLKFLKKRKLRASLASFEWEKTPVTFAYPETFMNLSGEAVLALVRSFSLDWKKDLLIVVDDSALPFGRLRLRSRGSDGGHNGLKSICQHLGGSDYARLRMGIDSPSKNIPLEEYVLSPFDSDEKKELRDFLEKGLEASKCWALNPIHQAMNIVNAEQATS